MIKRPRRVRSYEIQLNPTEAYYFLEACAVDAIPIREDRARDGTPERKRLRIPDGTASTVLCKDEVKRWIVSPLDLDAKIHMQRGNHLHFRQLFAQVLHYRFYVNSFSTNRLHRNEGYALTPVQLRLRPLSVRSFLRMQDEIYWHPRKKNQGHL